MLWDKKAWKLCQNPQKKVRIRENEVQEVAVCDVPRPTGATKCVIFPQNPVCLIFLYPDSSNLLSCTHDSLQTHSISRSADGPVSEDPYRVNASGKIPHFYPLS